MGPQTSAIGGETGLLSFDFCFDHLWFLRKWLEVAKSDLGFMKVLKVLLGSLRRI